MALPPGTRLGAYQIVSAIGAGGMGEVYRAHDATLDRDVAIKVLPEAFAADADRLARFEREARVLASLNHPNIATIHGLERSGATAFLIMELAIGETLAARVARGRLPADEAIAVATQIGSALEAAHEKGIIHRDLKPANIVVSPDGKVKVLDFGLAKALSHDGPAIDVSLSPTMAHAGTMAGVILGTAAYMSPEQARGKTVDKRADIWAFGCVLYEMLAGKAAFAGETLTDIVAAVVKNDPDWSALPVDTPTVVRSVLRRCLKKEPAERLHDVADARIEIQDAMAQPTPVPVVVPRIARARGWTRAVAPLASAAMAVVLTLLVAWIAWRRGDAPRGAVRRLEINLPASVEIYLSTAPGVALSPDNTRIAFIGVLTGQRQVYVRSLDRFESQLLRGTDTVQTLAFSADGAAIAFVTADRTLKRVTLSDGLVTLVVRDADSNSGIWWGPDDRITFSRNDGLWQVTASGGPAVPLTKVDRSKHEVLHMWPNAVAGGKTILFTALTGDVSAVPRIEAVAIDSKQRRVIVEAAVFPVYVPSGHLVFFRDGALLALPFNVERLAATGPAVRVVDNIATDVNGIPLAAISSAGTLAYAPGETGTSRLVWVSRQGLEQPITDASKHYQSPRLAPDGRRVVLQIGGDLWINDLARTTSTRLTSGDTVGTSFPVWSADGTRVVFRSRIGMRWIEVEGGGGGHAIPGSTGIEDIPNSLSPDGDTLAFLRQSVDTSGDIYVVSLRGTSPPRVVVGTPVYEGGAQFSPDGRWLAYASNESGQLQVYVRPFPGPDRRAAVSTQGGSFPLWRRDGKELFYRTGNRMMGVDVSTGGGNVTLSQPHVLFDQRYLFETLTIANYDVSLDGQRFLMVKDESGSGRLNVVLNWLDELKRLAPTK